MFNNVKDAISTNPKRVNCIGCITKNHSLLNELSIEELEILNKNKYGLFYKSGQEICKKGSKSYGLLCLNKGKVKIVRNGNNGTQQIVALRKPGDFLGFRALMGDKLYMATAIALEDAFVCVIDKNDFFKVIGTNKTLSLKIIQFFADELLKNDSRLVSLTQKHLRGRLADALLMINEFFGTFPDTGYLNIKLKRSDLAALANMTTANAIRLLSSFTEENLIEVQLRNIKIIDLGKLQKISGLSK